jgi:hypothetical protein
VACSCSGLKVEAGRVRRGGFHTCGGVLGFEPLRFTLVGRLGYFFSDYFSYRKGCERFGIWWKLFRVSMVSFAVTFILVAIGPGPEAGRCRWTTPTHTPFCMVSG